MRWIAEPGRSGLVGARRRATAAVAAAVLVAAAVGSPVGAVQAPAARIPMATSRLAEAPVSVAAAVPAISLAPFASGLSQPVFITSARDGTNRLFIVEKSGRIKVWKNGAVNATPLLDLSALVSQGSEQGLLGLAFPSNFATTHKLYVDYTRTDGDTIVAEYRTGTTGNPDVASPATRRGILHTFQPYDNHNGGMLAFGRDGYLYIGLGDGGSSGDPGNRAQSLATLLGKLLRIDVSAPGATLPYRIPASNPYVGRTGSDQIWDYGLRNPWRFSFDRSTGDLWIGDVGQSSWEEVDRASWSSTNQAGRAYNWGWHVMEGRHCYSPPSGCNTIGKRLPPVEYSHVNGRCAITGGYVYRGTRIPALVGAYVFGDYCSGELWFTRPATTSTWPMTLLMDTNLNISSFGEDAAGELYVCDLNGAIYKLVPA